MNRLVYLDESGDLGWKFNAPFGKGGSSRHITIASAFTCLDANKHLCRTVKKAKKRVNWDAKKEMKWVDMPHDLRIWFCEKAAEICQQNDSIEYRAIVVAKQGVQERLRHDDSMLYNYFIKAFLLNPISRFEHVTLIPDPRGIAPNSGNPLQVYLQGFLFERAFNGHPHTTLGIRQVDSQAEYGIQFADMLAGAIQLHYEGVCSEYYEILKSCLVCDTYFFPAAHAAERSNRQTVIL
ncbi:DUF3800 domain-containing protein [Vreelandella aquamarina]|uniref:DUF3800 domain-containing protein n=1 Tax=Vreelandella aquamarina TaxID=77097 RepID=UPI0035303A7E